MLEFTLGASSTGNAQMGFAVAFRALADGVFAGYCLALMM